MLHSESIKALLFSLMTFTRSNLRAVLVFGSGQNVWACFGFWKSLCDNAWEGSFWPLRGLPANEWVSSYTLRYQSKGLPHKDTKYMKMLIKYNLIAGLRTVSGTALLFSITGWNLLKLATGFCISHPRLSAPSFECTSLSNQSANICKEMPSLPNTCSHCWLNITLSGSTDNKQN